MPVTREWIVKTAGSGGAGELKATFGLVRALEVEDDLTNHFICRTGGTFANIAVNAKTAPTGSAARLVIEKSTDEGVSWANVLASPAYIELAAGDTTVQTYSNFAVSPADSIAAGNLLRINCTQKGSTIPGQHIEVVLRWV